MLINSAWASPTDTAPAPTTTSTATPPVGDMPPAPGSGETFAMNMGMVLVMVALFYLLLIRPQQKRFKDHASMLSRLDKGTKIVTQGGLVGTIDKEISEHELLVDFGNGVKISAMRSAIMGRYEDAFPKAKPANDDTKVKSQDKTKK